MARARVALLLFVAAAACKTDARTEVHLTIVADASITDDVLGTIVVLDVAVSGDESFHRIYPLADHFAKRRETWIYVPKIHGGSLTFTMTVRDAAGPVGAGQGSVTIGSGAQPLTVTLTSMLVIVPDDGGGAGKGRGEACGAGECGGGLFCVDGVCCDSTCTGPCQACDLPDSVGTCTTLASGQPHGARAACAGAGTTCAGACTGGAGCSYPPTSTVCGAACDGKCDGAGGCSSGGGGACPGGFACGASGCKTSCAGPTDCQTNFTCSGTSCVRVPESDCLDGKDNNGDGLADCADPTCVDVECVAAVPFGTDIGLLQTTACPSTNFATSLSLHQSLNLSNCNGCNCTPSTTCKATMAFGSACPVTTGFFDVTATCQQNTTGNTNPAAIQAFLTATGPTTCSTPASVGSPPSPMWTTNKTFCAVSRSSATCPTGANQVCVAKPPAAAPLCVRTPGAGGTCPAGYTNTGDWYPDQADMRTCGACTCHGTSLNGSCASVAFRLYTSLPNVCPAGSGSSFGSICINQPGSYCYTKGTIDCAGGMDNWSNIQYFQTNGFDGSGGTCNPPTSAVSGTPTGGSTVCCK